MKVDLHITVLIIIRTRFLNNHLDVALVEGRHFTNCLSKLHGLI